MPKCVSAQVWGGNIGSDTGVYNRVSDGMGGKFPEGVILGLSRSAGEAEVLGRANSWCKGPEAETGRTQCVWSTVRRINERAGDLLPS